MFRSLSIYKVELTYYGESLVRTWVIFRCGCTLELEGRLWTHNCRTHEV